MTEKARFAGLLGLGLLAAALFAATGGLARAQTPPPDPPIAVFNALGLTSEDTANSRGESASADGKKVVGYYNTWSPRGFVWDFNFDPVTKGELGVLAGPYTETYGICISADGRYAAGRGWTLSDGSGDNIHRAYFWEFSNGIWMPTALPILLNGAPGYYDYAYGMNPEASVLVGSSSSARGLEAARWLATVDEYGARTWTVEPLGDLPGGDYWGQAYGCSADGGIIVGQSMIRGGTRAFRWEDGGLADIGTLPKLKWSAAWACSADGTRIVGESFNNRGRDEKAFLWESGKMTAIPDLPGGKVLNEATDISPNGRYIVGWGMSAAGVEAFIFDTETGTLNTIKALLQSQGNALPAGWTPQFVSDVTDPDANGQVTVVGRGLNPQGKVEGYRAVITPQ